MMILVNKLLIDSQLILAISTAVLVASYRKRNTKTIISRFISSDVFVADKNVYLNDWKYACDEKDKSFALSSCAHATDSIQMDRLLTVYPASRWFFQNNSEEFKAICTQANW